MYSSAKMDMKANEVRTTKFCHVLFTPGAVMHRVKQLAYLPQFVSQRGVQFFS
jgi:hypothetical protein